MRNTVITILIATVATIALTALVMLSEFNFGMTIEQMDTIELLSDPAPVRLLSQPSHGQKDQLLQVTQVRSLRHDALAF